MEVDGYTGYRAILNDAKSMIRDLGQFGCMRIFTTVTACLYVLVAAEAQANGFYIEGQFGAASPNQIENSDEIETESEFQFFGGIAVGRKFTAPFGIEELNVYLEGNFTNRHFELHGLNVKGAKSAATGNIGTFGISSNLWIGYEFTPSLEIYAGGGPGVTLVEVDSMTSTGLGLNDASDADVRFSYTLGAGALYSLSEEWTLNVGYRYAGIPRYNVKSYQGELSSHAAMVGVRYGF